MQLILEYVSTDFKYFKTPYNSDRFLHSGSSSSDSSSSSLNNTFQAAGKRPYNVSFNLTPILDNSVSLIKLNPAHQVKVRKPKETATLKQHEKYINQVLCNFKGSKHYLPFPNRATINLLYVCKKFYRLALPLVYRKIKFHSSYRFAQFITSIRSNNRLGLLVEEVQLAKIDTLYYLSYDSASNDSYLVITDKEKNKIEQLINNADLHFDGTFDNVNMDEIPSSRINLSEYVNSTTRLPILLIKDEHSVINSGVFFDFENYDFGYKPKIVLAGWREWKYRYDPLYNTPAPTIELVNSLTLKQAIIRKSHSTGNFKDSAQRPRSNSTQNQQHRLRSNSIARISLRNSLLSVHSTSALAKFSSRDSVGGSLRTKFRKIVYKMSHKKVESSNAKSAKPTHYRASVISTTDKNNNNNNYNNATLKKSPKLATGKTGQKATSSSNVYQFNQHPMQNKLLHKYSTKDIPIGYIVHLLKICCNLKSFDMSKIVIASDYEIRNDQVDDYGILQIKKLSTGGNSSGDDGIANANMLSLKRPAYHTRAISDSNPNSSIKGLSKENLHVKSKSITDFNNIDSNFSPRTSYGNNGSSNNGSSNINNNDVLSFDMLNRNLRSTSNPKLSHYIEVSNDLNFKNANNITRTFSHHSGGGSGSGSNNSNTNSNGSNQKDDSYYTNILREIDSAYGTSIYSQFSSVYQRRNDMMGNNRVYHSIVSDDASQSLDGKNQTTNSSNNNGKSLDFYKDSFGYSSNCNYRQIRSNFYRNFWGYSNFNSRYDKSKESFHSTNATPKDYSNNIGNEQNAYDTASIRASQPSISRPESPPGGYRHGSPVAASPQTPKLDTLHVPQTSFGNVLLRDEVKSQESFVLVNEERKLLSLSSEIHNSISNGNANGIGASNAQQQHLTINTFPQVQPQVQLQNKSKQNYSHGNAKQVSTGTSVNHNHHHNHQNKIQINIIQELEDEEHEGKANLEIQRTRSPTVNYFLFEHQPGKLESENQNDDTLYLSDVRKSNYWTIDQLRKVSNAEILTALTNLKTLERIKLRSANWLNTKDVKTFLSQSRAIKTGNLQTIDFRNSGMRRDLKWAIEGSVQELKKSLKEDEPSIAAINVGRNYSRF